MQNTVLDRHSSTGPGPGADRRRAEPDPELMSPATQIVGDTDDYLGNANQDIGRRIADDQFELFVVCHPVEAIRQQFAHRTPEFIVIHDIGGTASSRLLAAVAGATKRKLQSLVIRRQGYGVALATLQFVEIPLQPGRTLRVYSTQIDSDTQTRQQLAQILLAHSRLGVMMVAELPPHALASSLQPFGAAINGGGPWPNRQLLLVPLAAAPTLPTQAAAMSGDSGVVVRTTPQVSRPAEAWSFISGAWNRLNNKQAEGATPTAPTPAGVPAPTTLAAAPQAHALGTRTATGDFPPPAIAGTHVATQPVELSPDTAGSSGRTTPGEGTTPARVGLNPMPSTVNHAAVPQGAIGSTLWADYVQRCMNIKGVTQACVFDIEQQRSLGHSGPQRMAERMAAKGAMLHAVMVDTSTVLGLGPTEPDAAITLAQHFLLIRPMPGKPGIALHLVLERNHGNIGLARAQLLQIDQALLGTHA